MVQLVSPPRQLYGIRAKRSTDGSIFLGQQDSEILLSPEEAMKLYQWLDRNLFTHSTQSLTGEGV